MYKRLVLHKIVCYLGVFLMLTGKKIDPDRRPLAGGTLPTCFVVVAVAVLS